MYPGARHTEEARQKISRAAKVRYAAGKMPWLSKRRRDVPSVEHVPDDFGHWLAGFVAGEGCFYNGHQATLQIQLGIADEAILSQIRDVLGFGVARRGTNGQGKVTALYRTSALAECVAIVRLFERFPLRGAKQESYLRWARRIQADWAAVLAESV